MTNEITITFTRWMMLRVWPSAWREALPSIEVNGRVLTPRNPLAWVLFVFGVVAILLPRRSS